jgi:hypothetical protein
MGDTMRYVSALKDSAAFRRMMNVMIFLLCLPLIAIIAFLYIFLKESGMKLSEIPIDYLIIILVLLPFTAVGILVVKLLYRRQISTTVEISSESVRHLAPGKEQIIRWADVIRVDLVKFSNRSGSVRIVTGETSYVFDPYLVEDNPTALRIRFTLMGPRWQQPDGTRIHVSIQNSTGYKAVTQYRPDLLE